MYKLILVEDNVELIEGIKSLIDWSKNQVEICGIAKNGILGLQLARDKSPDIVITDIKMPLMNGLDFLKNLKENGIETKNIVLSGYDEFAYAQKALRYNTIEYLLKPCKPDEILNAVLKAIKLIEDERFNKNLLDICKSSLSNLVSASAEDNSKSKDTKASELIEAAKNYIMENYSNELNLQNVANHIYISSAYLSKLFKNELNMNFVDYVNKFRIQKSMELLRNVKYKNYEVAALVGYTDEKYFYQMFKKYVGITPNEYRKLI